MSDPAVSAACLLEWGTDMSDAADQARDLLADPPIGVEVWGRPALESLARGSTPRSKPSSPTLRGVDSE